MEAIEHVKLTVVGDGAVGKTSLLCCYVDGSFPQSYVPTVFDNKATNVMVDGTTAHLTLWDTAGQEEYDRLRPLSYPGTQVFLVCFSVVSATTLKNVKAKWVPEIVHHVPDSLFILVGLKKDLRATASQRDEDHVSPTEGAQAAQELGAARYVECSSLTQENVPFVFEEALRAFREARYGVSGSSGSPSGTGAGAGGRHGKRKKVNCSVS